VSNERTRSPRRAMTAATLTFEAITLGLTTPVMISVVGVPAGVACAVGLGLAALCVVVAGLLRRPWAYAIGWAIQVAAIGLGLVIGLMFVLGGIFAILWGLSDILGRRIERDRAAAFAEWDRLEAERLAREG